jgi:mRNA interferase RelE/StbE
MEIKYHPHILSEDLPKMSGVIKLRIKKAIEKKLMINPTIFGEPLRGTLIPLWKLRVGDFRIVFGISNDTVYVHAIGHRKEIYKNADNRNQI